LKSRKNNYSYLADEFGIAKIGIFGSMSQRTSSEKSDFDIVVEFRKPIGLKFINLANYLGNLLHTMVDPLTHDGIDSIRIKRISYDVKRNIIYAQTQ
jgi:predicted nucleotidyltransferase